MCTQTGEEEPEDDEEETAADRDFIDDAPVQTQAGFRDMDELPQ